MELSMALRITFPQVLTMLDPRPTRELVCMPTRRASLLMLHSVSAQIMTSLLH